MGKGAKVTLVIVLLVLAVAIGIVQYKRAQERLTPPPNDGQMMLPGGMPGQPDQPAKPAE